jgi:hypothetical protein
VAGGIAMGLAESEVVEFELGYGFAIFEVEVFDGVVAVLRGPFAWSARLGAGDGRGRQEREENEAGNHD